MVTRDQTLSVKLTVEELAMLTVMADGAGCDPEEFLRSYVRRSYLDRKPFERAAKKERTAP